MDWEAALKAIRENVKNSEVVEIGKAPFNGEQVQIIKKAKFTY